MAATIQQAMAALLNKAYLILKTARHSRNKSIFRLHKHAILPDKKFYNACLYSTLSTSFQERHYANARRSRLKPAPRWHR
ncbi:MAG: hypothetical protein KA084_00005, partial [Brachymonas sp.]|nr:hypothetical protein [Brachymonas sp.]MBP7733762.1 hypothetical protein [Brachymonas sp.]